MNDRHGPKSALTLTHVRYLRIFFYKLSPPPPAATAPPRDLQRRPSAVLSFFHSAPQLLLVKRYLTQDKPIISLIISNNNEELYSSSFQAATGAGGTGSIIPAFLLHIMHAPFLHARTTCTNSDHHQAPPQESKSPQPLQTDKNYQWQRSHALTISLHCLTPIYSWRSILWRINNCTRYSVDCGTLHGRSFFG